MLTYGMLAPSWFLSPQAPWRRLASRSINQLRRPLESVATTQVLIFIYCWYYGSDSTAPESVNRCRFALILPVIVETSAQSASEWGQLTPAEEEGVDGRKSTARGNNTAAGCLVPINIRQKWEILAGRLAHANFPKGCEVIFLASTGIQGLMYLLELKSYSDSRVRLWVFSALSWTYLC